MCAHDKVCVILSRTSRTSRTGPCKPMIINVRLNPSYLLIVLLFLVKIASFAGFCPDFYISEPPQNLTNPSLFPAPLSTALDP